MYCFHLEGTGTPNEDVVAGLNVLFSSEGCGDTNMEM
jgi:hypothetical protein